MEEIIEGNKKYEFRKTIFKKEAKQAFIYSSSPTKKIVGLFSIGEITRNTPQKLWADFRDLSGIDEQEFFNYFRGKDEGFAIEINNLKIFDNPLNPKQHLPRFTPPQSFCYAPDSLTNDLRLY